MVGCQNYLFSFSCLSLRQLLFLVLQDWGFLRNPPVSCGSQTPPHIFSENSLSFLQCQKISNVVMRSQALDCFWLLSQWQFFYSFNFSLLEFYPREGRVCYSSPMTQVFLFYFQEIGGQEGAELSAFFIAASTLLMEVFMPKGGSLPPVFPICAQWTSIEKKPEQLQLSSFFDCQRSYTSTT